MDPQSNQYDFILNPTKPPKRSVLPSNNGLITRLAVVLGIIVLVIIAFVVGSSLFSGKSNVPKLTVVAQQQAELIRIANLETTIAPSQASQQNRDFTESCLLSITSAQQNLTAFLSKHGVKLSTKVLGLAKNVQTDSTLNAAAAASTFNAAYTNVMQNQLGLYETALKTAYTNTQNATEKTFLAQDYAGAQLLLKQLTGTQD